MVLAAFASDLPSWDEWIRNRNEYRTPCGSPVPRALRNVGVVDGPSICKSWSSPGRSFAEGDPSA